MQIERGASAHSNYEYGCDLRRLYPSSELGDPLYWGAAIASVRPGEATTAHAHDECETFLIISGQGSMEIEEEVEVVSTGDVIRIPRLKNHRIANLDADQPLVFLTIFWDSPEARDAISKHLTGVGLEVERG